MKLTKKIRIYPDQTTSDALWEISHLCTTLQNACIEQRRDKKSQGHVNGYTQMLELPEIKRELPEFKIPSSKLLQEVCKDIDRSYKSFFALRKNGDEDAKPPWFKSKNYFYTQTYPQRSKSFDIKDNILSLVYTKDDIKHLTIQLPEGSYDLIKYIQIYREDTGKQYVCMVYEVEDVPLKQIGNIIYFDPGCITTLTGLKSTGEFIEYDLNPLRKINMDTFKLIDQLTSERDKKKKGSMNYRRLNSKIKKLWRKINHRTKVYLHTLANIILKENPDVKLFRIGNWKKKETVSVDKPKFVNKKINRAVQNNNPLQKLIGYLTYKARMLGQVVDKFDERGSTRTCPMCNYVFENGVDPKERMFVCGNSKCGFRFPRDLKSCLSFYKRYESALWQSLVDRLQSGLLTRSVRKTLHPFSLKPKVSINDFRLELYPSIEGCPAS